MSDATLEILRPGLQTIVVARERSGHRDVGVGLCGALDAGALARANELAGNPPDAPALEIAYGSFSARFARPMRLAIAGAECGARFDGVHLALDAPSSGVRTYLAVRGGFEVPFVLGSQTTDVRGGFGGWHGRALRAGDVLPIAGEPVADATMQVATQAYASPAVARAIDRDAPPEFWTRTWRVSPMSDRMGMRLSGGALDGGGDAASHAVFPGVVQLPAGGEPIVLLADAQTTGGYRAIASVVAADLWVFAQLPAGGMVNFEKYELIDED